MTEKGYKGGLVSRVKNIHSGKKYVISTAQELGQDYWTTAVFPAIFLGFLPNFSKKLFVIVRNSKEAAHEVHETVKDMVLNAPESRWFGKMPNPQPAEGWSDSAKKKLGKNQVVESMKEKFDEKFPEAKKLREMELKRTSRNLYNQSSFGKATSVIYPIVALGSIFVYWKFFEVNIFLSILYGLITWFVITYIFDKIFIKLLGVEKAVRKANDEEIEMTGKQLEETLKEEGRSTDDLLK